MARIVNSQRQWGWFGLVVLGPPLVNEGAIVQPVVPMIPPHCAKVSENYAHGMTS